MKASLIALTALLIPAISNANNLSLSDTFQFNIGGYKVNTNTSVYTEAYNNSGETIASESLDLDDLALDSDHSSYWLNASWRFAEDWSVMFEYFGYSESGRQRADQDRQLFEKTFLDGAQLDSQFDMDIVSLSVLYQLLRTEQSNLELGFGLHSFDASLQLDGTIEGDAGNSYQGQERATLLAPLPNLMLQGRYVFTDQLSVQARIGWLSLSMDEYSGDLIRAGFNLDYRPFQHVGLGLGYNYSDINAKEENRFTLLKYDIEFSGPLLYLQLGF